jgi:TRAP-type C4-dicarboxylate transport system permease small subunit
MTATKAQKRSGAEALSAALDKWTGLACALFIGAMTIIVIVGVLFRYVLNAPLNWVEETARYLMIWGASLAISIGISAGEHVGLTIILDGLKNTIARKALTLLINFIVFAFLAFMTYYSIGATIEAKNQMTQALGISMLLPRLAVPVAMGLSAIQIVLVSIMVVQSPDGKRAQAAGYIDI